ncbi:MAG: hypothetical protein IGS50_05565 [Synechococcales cyanobacterium C42_A2020_086]|nr:hypothetical protein [Synechococcales cyanobacterium C42_A2020_086]
MSSSTVINSELAACWRNDLSCWIDHLLIHLDALELILKAHPTSPKQSHSLAAPEEPALQQLLQQAVGNLRNSTLPHFLQVTLYLRLGCLAIQYRVLTEQRVALGNLYHLLLQWLWECDPDWWEHCQLTAQGITSSNRQIQALLQPIETVGASVLGAPISDPGIPELGEQLASGLQFSQFGQHFLTMHSRFNA